MPRVQAPRVFGTCTTANLVAEGLIISTVSSEDWHRHCLGISSGGELCICLCHPDPIGYCRRCGVDGNEPIEAGACLNPFGCRVRQRAKYADRPEYAWLVKITADLEPKPDREPRPVREGRCEHCGESTRGGRFAPGHDSQLKSSLLASAKDGDVDDAVEMMIRGWWKPRYARLSVHAAADTAYQLRGETWLRERIEARWAAL